MGKRTEKRANVSNDILRIIIDKGYAKNAADAARVYKALESLSTFNRDKIEMLSDGRESYFSSTRVAYNTLKDLGLTESQIRSLAKDTYNEMITGGITNLINYNRLDLGDDPVDLKDYFDNKSTNEEDARKDAFNSYYRDIMDWNDPNTTAGRTYDTMLEQERNAALDQMALTDMSAQQANLQQAAVVKQIADQVRNERMARLRAGMSESQIAQQDMANMMANMQAINDNANAMNQARLNARYAYNNASQTALDKYMNALQATGNIGTGMAAADTSNPIIMGTQYANLKYKEKKGVDNITGQKNNS